MVGRKSPPCRKGRDKDGAPVSESGCFDCLGFAQDDKLEIELRNMSIRSMTGFAQVKGQVNGQFGFTLSLKSVNHRFLDIHFRLPSDSDESGDEAAATIERENGSRSYGADSEYRTQRARRAFRSIASWWAPTYRRFAPRLRSSG